MHAVRFALGLLMVLHGIAHLPGFVGPWRLATIEGLPYRTTVLGGRLDIGDAGMRVLGAAWLALALGFGLAGALALANRPWWSAAATAAALASLVICLVQLPEARIGAVVDLLLLAALVVGRHFWKVGLTA